MIQNIIDAIAIALHSEFGSGYKIYQNDVSQGLAVPAFFIKMLNAQINPLLDGQVDVIIPFDVMYFPADEKNNAEMQGIGERLVKALRLIHSADGAEKYLAQNEGFEIVDNVLHYAVSYEASALREAEAAKVLMQTEKTVIASEGDSN